MLYIFLLVLMWFCDTFISVPHDGRVELPNIPKRKPGCKDDAGKCQFGDKIQTDKCKAKNVCKVILGSDLNASVIARYVFY